MSARHSARRTGARRWAGNVALAVVLGLAALGLVAVISGAYQIRPILSGSMRPGLPVGGVVVTERVPIPDLEVRGVVVLHRPDKPEELVVHRIISLTPSACGPVVETQGDANDIPDPWSATLQGDTAYRVVLSLPWIGYAAVWAHSPIGRRILFGLGAALVVAALGGLVRPGRAGTGARTSRRRGSRRQDTAGDGDPSELEAPPVAADVAGAVPDLTPGGSGTPS